MCVLQDVLVVTAPGSGAEIIPFLKTWVNLPMAIGFTVLYSAVSSRASLRSLPSAVVLALLVHCCALIIAED